MGLLAVMGPSRNDHFGLPRFCARNLSNAWVRSQNSRMERSRAGKSTWVSTFSSGMAGKLPRLDSNQDKESQNLLCYRYTTGYRANEGSMRTSTSLLALLAEVHQERELLQLHRHVHRDQADPGRQPQRRRREI